MQWLKKGSSFCHVLYGQIRLLICNHGIFSCARENFTTTKFALHLFVMAYMVLDVRWRVWWWSIFWQCFYLFLLLFFEMALRSCSHILLKKLKSMSHTTVFQIEEIICPTSSSMGKSKGRRSIFSKTLACKHSSMNFEIIAYTYMYYLRIWGDWQRRRYYCPCNWEVYR